MENIFKYFIEKEINEEEIIEKYEFFEQLGNSVRVIFDLILLLKNKVIFIKTSKYVKFPFKEIDKLKNFIEVYESIPFEHKIFVNSSNEFFELKNYYSNEPEYQYFFLIINDNEKEKNFENSVNILKISKNK